MVEVQCYICQAKLSPTAVRAHLAETKHCSVTVNTEPIRCALCFAGDIRQLVVTKVQQGRVLVTCKERCKVVMKERQFPNAEARKALVEDEDGLDPLLLQPKVFLCSIFDLCQPQSPPVLPSKRSVSQKKEVKQSKPVVEKDEWKASASDWEPSPSTEPSVSARESSASVRDSPPNPILPDSVDDEYNSTDIAPAEQVQPGLVKVPDKFDDKNQYQSIFSKYLEAEEEEDRKKKSAYLRDMQCTIQWRTRDKVLGEVMLKSIKDINPGDTLSITDSTNTEQRVQIMEIGVGGEACKVTFKKRGKSTVEVKKDDLTYILDFAEGTGFTLRKKGLKMFTGGDGFVCKQTADVILGQACPREHAYRCDFNDMPELNKSQRVAVQYALATEFALIQGPPGTGKTKTAATIIYKLHQISGESVLVCAPSNIAVDQLTITLAKFPEIRGKILRIYAKSRILQGEMGAEEFSLHIKLRERLAELHPPLKSILADKSQRDLNAIIAATSITDDIKLLEQAIVSRHSIICCTCATSLSSKIRKRYEYVLIDEAGFASEPDCLLPLLHNSPHVVMVGDHKQLPPVVFSKQVAALNYNRSMFERLIDANVNSKMLSEQYRMHPEIAAFPSERFYNNELSNGVNAEDRTTPAFEAFKALHKATSAVLYFHIPGKEEELEHSYSNFKEIKVVAVVLAQLQASGIPADSIGVISPYEAQRKKLIEFINSRASISDKDVEVKNVDGFQGREKDIIVFTSVRANPGGDIGFLNDFRRLNVAITRARFGLVMVGDRAVVKRNEHWRSLVEKLESGHCVRDGTALIT